MDNFIVPKPENWKQYCNVLFRFFPAQTVEDTMKNLPDFFLKIQTSAKFHGFDDTDKLVSYIDMKMSQENITTKPREVDEVVTLVQCWMAEDMFELEGE